MHPILPFFAYVPIVFVPMLYFALFMLSLFSFSPIRSFSFFPLNLFPTQPILPRSSVHYLLKAQSFRLAKITFAQINFANAERWLSQNHICYM